MAKAAPPYIKYMIYAEYYVDGVVERPDVIGAIFGQTEGLLGEELDLRELQRAGKIGRIEVTVNRDGKRTYGEIIIPTSLNRFETSLIAAALETINRVGPAHAVVKVKKIENIRKVKVQYILERAKDLLRTLTNEELPDSKELITFLEYAHKMKSLTTYGPEKLPAGPDVAKAEEIIIVEGRADVLNLLKYGITNVIALNGLNVPKTIVDLSKKKITTVFMDGDRAGDLLIKELYLNGVDIDFVARPEPGREVEELSRKEIIKALKNKVPFDQVKQYYEKLEGNIHELKRLKESKMIHDPVLSKLKQHMEKIFKTEQAVLLDQHLNVINKVPVNKIQDVLKNNNRIFAIVMDGILTRELLEAAEKAGVKYIVCLDTIQKQHDSVKIYTIKDLDRVK